jgi:hypothetical protein
MKPLAIVALMVSLIVPMCLAKDKKPAPPAPIYDMTGTMGFRFSSAYSASYTGADGQTLSVQCRGTDNSMDCWEGTGLTYTINLSDGSIVTLLGRTPVEEFGHSIAFIGREDPLSPIIDAASAKRRDAGMYKEDNDENKIYFHFRLAQGTFPYGKLVCLPWFDELDKHGNVKHHREACYAYD